MGRTDDIINVAGHRLSTGGMEEVLASHPDVAECAVLGIKDAVKGEVPCGFLVLKAGVTKPVAEIEKEIVALVRDKIGPVADGLVEQFARAGRGHDAALRKGDNLDRHLVPMCVTRRRHLFKVTQSDLWIDIDVAAHVGRSLRNAQFDQAGGAYGNRLRLGKCLFLKLDPFADVEACGAQPMRLPFVADETLVEMDMAVHQTRQHEAMFEIGTFTCRNAQTGCDSGNAPVLHGDIDRSPIGQSCILKQRVDIGQLKSPNL